MRQTAYNTIDNIGKEQKLTPEQKHEIALLQDAFFNCFNTETGKEVLKHLEKKYLEKPVAMPGAGRAGDQFAYFREGENNVIRYIKDKIKESENRRQNK
jgi:hypothetical protein